MTGFPMLFSPLTINQCELQNRVVMLPMSPQLATDGVVSPRILDFYAARAAGGAGLIVIGATYVDRAGSFGSAQTGISEDAQLSGLKQLADVIKKAGSKSIIQLHHAGRRSRSANTGLETVAPSAIAEFAGAEVPRALTLTEIEDLVEQYAQAAIRAEKAGFNGVEIHCAHGYLPAQFFCPTANHRLDAYGGDLAGRTLFARQLIAACRQRVSPSFLVTVRISGENGLSLEEMIPIARSLAEAGAEIIHVSAGDTPHRVVPDYYWPEGVNRGLAASIRQAVSVPVIACGRIRTPELAESILSSGQADLIGLGRALLIDPDFPRKAASGERDAIRYCLGCNQVCHNPKRTIPGIACTLNARTGREADFPIDPVPVSKRVVVVGGGVGGCEAALTLAQLGHRVTLLEANQRLGGKLSVAAAPPQKEHFLDIVTSFERALELAGVEVVLGQLADADRIMQEKPQAVILATGSRPLIPPLPGLERPEVVTAEAVLAQTVVPSSRAVIVGAGSVGLETAHYLVENGCQVTIIEMLDEAGKGLTNSAKEHLIRVLAQAGVSIRLNTALMAVEEGCVRVRSGEQIEELPVQQVILATGYRAEKGLAGQLAGHTKVLVVGDAAEPRDIESAVCEGAKAAYAV